jgi:NACalpha-BTF3-like transcription factor
MKDDKLYLLHISECLNQGLQVSFRELVFINTPIIFNEAQRHTERKVINALEAGLQGNPRRQSHFHEQNQSGWKQDAFNLPNHKEIKSSTLLLIVRQTEITREEFIEALMRHDHQFANCIGLAFFSSIHGRWWRE